jgi:glutaredoxin
MGAEMRSGKSLFALLILLCASTAQAQLYKWVGPDGKVTYSDVPPPASIKQVETKSLSGGGPSTAGLPYELSEAVKNSPVKLYTSAKCRPCDDGRRLLNTRGIPFTEKTVSTNQDIEQLRQLSGEAQLPVLVVGRSKQSGFDSSAWNSALSDAGYPASSRLPSNYHNGNVEPAAPTAKAETPEAKNDAPAPNYREAPPPPAGNAPPGFRF